MLTLHYERCVYQWFTGDVYKTNNIIDLSYEGVLGFDPALGVVFEWSTAKDDHINIKSGINIRYVLLKVTPL